MHKKLLNNKRIDLIEFHNLFWSLDSDIRKRQIEFFMNSDSYIPEQMEFRKIKVNGRGKHISGKNTV